FGAAWVGGTATGSPVATYKWGTAANWDPSAIPADDADNTFGLLAGNYYAVDLGGVDRYAKSLTFTDANPYTFYNGTLTITNTANNPLINLTNASNSQVTISSSLTFMGSGKSFIGGGTNANTRLTLTGMVDSTAKSIDIRGGVV